MLLNGQNCIRQIEETFYIRIEVTFLRLIDADKIVNYEITGNFSCGELNGTDKSKVLSVN